MTEKEQRTHELAMKIVKLLIESGLSINDQLKVINDVREKLLFCKKNWSRNETINFILVYLLNKRQVRRSRKFNKSLVIVSLTTFARVFYF